MHRSKFSPIHFYVIDKPYDQGFTFTLPNHPVVGITWYKSLAFTRWLTEKWLTEKWQKENLLPHGWIVQLPSDNENPRRINPWGDSQDTNKANIKGSEIGSTSAVGCFSLGASPYGCEDVVGNAWELTRNLDKQYPYDPDDGGERI